MSQNQYRSSDKVVVSGGKQAHIWAPDSKGQNGAADYSPGSQGDDGKSSQSFLLDGSSDKSSTVDSDAKVISESDETSTTDSSSVFSKSSGRGQWSKETEFVLAAVGNAVGLGNLWRFPYLCYISGGGAFLIPYFIMLVICGIPLLYMELGVGQYTRRGPIGALRQLCPFFQGAGMATVVLSFLFTTYYNVILAWAIFYLFASFQDPLPWGNCNNTWNTPQCWDDYSENASLYRPNDTVAPSQEYYENRVLQQSDGIEDQGTIVWELALLLLMSWAIVYFCLWRGIRWTGKIVYFTATFPYLVIILLIIRGLTLPGASDGVDFFIRPVWEDLAKPEVWVNAAAQNFNSIGIAFGSMIAFSSYNKRDTNIFRDSLIICVLNSATSILAGFAVFSILGNIAFNQGKDVTDVVTEGPGLVFIVYPEAFVAMPTGVAQFLAVLFFFMLICLAVDSQFASVEVVITTLEDQFGVHIMKVLRRRELLVLVVCIVCFFLGFPNITNGGIYFFKIIDYYSSSISLMLIALFEVIAIAWFYGAKRLGTNIKDMTGRRPYLYFTICWYVLSPLLITVIMVFNWVQYIPVSYGDYVFPKWAEGLGWGLACMSLICLPIGMTKGVVETVGDTFFRKIRNSFKPLIDTAYSLDDKNDDNMVVSSDTFTSKDPIKNLEMNPYPEKKIPV